MKTTLFALGLDLCLSASAQVGTYYAVTFYPTNSPQVLAGYPRWEPVDGGVRALGHTNGPLIGAEVLFDEAGVNNLINTNRAGLAAYQRSLPIPGLTNLLAWQALYNQMPLGKADSYARSNTLYSVYRSLLSGTNTQAQVNTNVTVMAQNLWISFIYLNQMLECFVRIGPSLQGIYDPTRDPTSQ